MSMANNAKIERMTRMGLLAEPAGYVDGANVYEYVASDPEGLVDPAGLARAATQPASGPATTLGPGAGIPYVVQQINEGENKFRNCWLYRAAGLDKLFANLTSAALGQSAAALPPGSGTAGIFNQGTYNIPATGYPWYTAVHESVHAYNYGMGYHQSSHWWSEGNAQRADEGMAWGVEQMLKAAAPLCDPNKLSGCKTCADAQKLWDSVFSLLQQVEGSACGNRRYPDTISRTHLWDINTKLGVRFSAAQLRPQFEAALKSHGLNCTVTNPAVRAPNKAGQPDPFA
jgi:hypothetical protein